MKKITALIVLFVFAFNTAFASEALHGYVEENEENYIIAPEPAEVKEQKKTIIK